MVGGVAPAAPPTRLPGGRTAVIGRSTIAATCSLTENLEFVVEYSCTDQGSDMNYAHVPIMTMDGTAHFGGIQFRFHY